MRRLRSDDIDAAVALHEIVLSQEFISQCGVKFLRRYYSAWMWSESGVALGAFDDGTLIGVHLGSLDPSTHYRAMLRSDGIPIALSMISYAAFHPRFAKDLVVTRGARYARGVGRALVAGLRRRDTPAATSDAERVGEVTHLFVSPSRQSSGVGASLLATMESLARVARVASLVLVTPPESPATGFYEHEGWQREDEIENSEGERFVRYRYPLT